MLPSFFLFIIINPFKNIVFFYSEDGDEMLMSDFKNIDREYSNSVNESEE